MMPTLISAHPKRHLTLALLLLLGPTLARAEDGGVSDAPVVTILPGPVYQFNERAFTLTNEEMKRLQGVERQHLAERAWVPVVVGLAVGVTLGLVGGVVIGFTAHDAIKATAP